MVSYAVHPVGVVRSEIRRREDAPRQGYEGGTDAWVEIDPRFVDALDGIGAGSEILLLTWLHLSERDVLKVYPRRHADPRLTGVFATRSPDRPNPIGLHKVTVVSIEKHRLQVRPLEALDGTPVLDIKPLLCGVHEA